MDINEALNKIIYKWDMDQYYPDYRKCMHALEYVKNYFGKKRGCSILLLGTDLLSLKVVYDSVPKGIDVSIVRFTTIDEITNESVVEYNSYDEIYWVSISKGEYVAKLHGCGIKIIALYDLFNIEGLVFDKEFFLFYPIALEITGVDDDGRNGDYLDCVEYIKQRQNISYATEERENRVYQEKCFFMALHMRNFVLAEKIANEVDDDRLKKCWLEVVSLLEEIREKMMKRKQRDIVIYYMSALSEKKSSDMKYLQSRKENSYYFTNAYTVMHYTDATIQTIFRGVKPVTDAEMSILQLNKSNSELIRTIYDKGYEFRICSGYLSRFFDREFHVPGTRKGSPYSKELWNGFNAMLNTSNPTVWLLHEYLETHEPFLTPYNETLEVSLKYVINGRQETDKQLEFYDNLISPVPYRIYMSDYGIHSHKHRFHSVLQVYHKQWTSKVIDALYSHLDFARIIYQILDEGKLDISGYNRWYVPIEEPDRYYLQDVKTMLKENKYIEALHLGYTGVIDGKNIYIRYRTGEECFFEISQLPDEGVDINISQSANIDECYKNKLRKVVDSYPQSLMETKKFVNTHIITGIHNRVKVYRKQVKRLLNDLFSEKEDYSVALRMGGLHSITLIGWLTEANRKKVGAIIDCNPKCLGAKLGVPVISSGKLLPKDIKSILLSSKESLNMLREEAEKIYSDYEVIDIYKILEENGFVCKSDYFYGDVTCYEGFAELLEKPNVEPWCFCLDDIVG